ncbi:DUF4403 family protein [Adhaeribacter soli]|uniref:DUF4403 family protein n=1 Tax=Adhaeribacter soli TaxID=2607655 RepID=A0A5N1J6K6_9BACT|nr:DUF4403 family protein [Adhaeribacter soli]
MLIGAAFSLPACKSTTSLNTAAPVSQAAPAPAFERKLSTINVPVSFKVATLQSKLNQEFKGLLYNDENLNDDNVAVKVWKKGDVGIRAENNKIYFTIPLHIWVKGQYKWKACDICPTLEKSESTEFDFTAKSETALAFTEDYKIKTTTVGDFAWGDTKPVIELGPMKIGLARFVEPALRSQLGEITKMLDQEIQARVNIKQYIQQAWVQVQQPIKIDDTYDAWLKITPTAIRVSPLVARNGEISMRIGMNSFIETFTNGKPVFKANPTLPKLVTDSRIPDDVQIGLSGEISYDYATKLLKDQFAGKTFKFEGSDEVTIKDAAITPSGDKLIVMLDVDGKTKAGFITKKIKGKVFLQAVPYYDAETGSIKVRDVDYNLETRDKLLSSASWLAKNKFRTMIQDQINFPLKSQLEDTKKQIQKALNEQGRVHESVMLRGKVTDIVPDNIYLTPTAIKAIVNAKGNLTISIDKL